MRNLNDKEDHQKIQVFHHHQILPPHHLLLHQIPPVHRQIPLPHLMRVLLMIQILRIQAVPDKIAGFCTAKFFPMRAEEMVVEQIRGIVLH